VSNKLNIMIINLNYSLVVTTILFIIGMLGLVLNRKNILIIIISIEIMLLSINLNFVIFSIYLDDMIGQIYVLFILTVAATESALGLAIITAFYKLRKTIIFDTIKLTKG